MPSGCRLSNTRSPTRTPTCLPFCVMLLLPPSKLKQIISTRSMARSSIHWPRCPATTSAPLTVLAHSSHCSTAKPCAAFAATSWAASRGTAAYSFRQHLLNLLLDLADQKRPALHLVQADGVDQVRGTNQHPQ